MRISELLAEGYPDTIAAFSQEADLDQVKKTVAQYRDLVNRNQVQGNERNIDWWRKQGWEKFSQFVDEKSTQATKTQVKRRRAAGKSITLAEIGDWLVVIPLDHDASCFHGSKDWCVSQPSSHYFDSYFLDRDVVLIYCINNQTGDRWAIASHTKRSEIELYDKKDQRITEDQFKSATGFDPRQLISQIPHNDPRIAQAKQSRRELLAKIQQWIGIWEFSNRTRNAKLEELLVQAKHPELCLRYISGTGLMHGPQTFPPIISMAAVKTDVSAIQFIKNPSEAVQLAAVKHNGNTIKYIENPSEAAQLAAVNQTSNAIEFIKNPSEAAQLAAVNQTGNAIEFIKNPSEAVQLAAVNQFGGAIKFIENPSEAVQLAAVKETGYAIYYIKNPSEALQLTAVKQTGYAIKFIENPSEALQLAAVNWSGGAIQFIKNPTPKAIELAALKGYDKQGKRIQHRKQ